MHCTKCETSAPENAEKCSQCGNFIVADADKYFRAGMNALGANNAHRAVILLSDCLEINPQYTNAQYHLGVALGLADRYEDAEATLDAVLSKDPYYPGIHTATAAVAFSAFIHYRNQCESQRSILELTLKLALEFDPNDLDACFTMAHLQMAEMEFEQTLIWLDRAATIQPDSYAVSYAYTQTLLLMGRREEAAKMAVKTLALAKEGDSCDQEILDLVDEYEKRGALAG